MERLQTQQDKQAQVAAALEFLDKALMVRLVWQAHLVAVVALVAQMAGMGKVLRGHLLELAVITVVVAAPLDMRQLTFSALLALSVSSGRELTANSHQLILET